MLPNHDGDFLSSDWLLLCDVLVGIIPRIFLSHRLTIATQNATPYRER